MRCRARKRVRERRQNCCSHRVCVLFLFVYLFQILSQVSRLGVAWIVRLLEAIKVLPLLHDVVLDQVFASLDLLLQSRGPFINLGFSCLRGWLDRASLGAIRIWLQHLDLFVSLVVLLKRLSVSLECLNSHNVHRHLRCGLIHIASLV